MIKKHKYNFFQNTGFAINGLKIAFSDEKSFRLELIFISISIILMFYMDLVLVERLILLITAFLILIVELLNSAIENVVDLATSEFHILAKKAKDVAATAVMFSIGLHIFCWFFIYFFR